MIRIAILEDEVWIAAFIQTLVQKHFPSIEVVGIAHNGSEALQILRSQPTDVLLADINVPVLNGLQAIQQAKNEGISCEYIVITGYKDFEYVHTAMQYGVSDYLLKPIDEAAFCKTLQKLCNRITQKRDEQHYYANGQRVLREAFVYECLNGLLGPDVEEKYGFHLQEGFYNYAVVKFIHRILPHVTLNPSTLSQVTQECEAMLGRISAELELSSLSYAQGSFLYLFFSYPAERSAALQTALSEFYAAVFQLAACHSIGCNMGIGLPVTDIRNVHRSITQALAALNSEGAYVGKCIQFSDNIPAASQLPTYITEKAHNQLQKALVAADTSELISFIKSNFQQFVYEHQLIETETLPAIEYVSHILDTLIQIVEAQSQTQDIFFDSEVYPMQTCTTLTELCSAVSQFACQIKEKFEEYNTRNSNHIIRQALDYIDQHLSDALSLEALADILYMNASYLSSLFKQETGQNYRDYVIQCRLNKAKMLLRNSNEKIGNIAQAVGYSDSKHFGKMFKKEVGVTPKEYRSIYR